jgi:hypothetical protein
MAAFTTNWYLYKTYLHSISKASKTRKTEPPTRVHGSKKGAGINSDKQKAGNKTTKFDKVLLEAIDEGLSLLGEESKKAVYSHLEKTFKMNRRDIPHRIEEFTDAIEKLFGAGAKILEIHIMKCLFKKVDYKFKHSPKQKNITFREYVAALKLKKDNNIEERNLNRKQNGKKGKPHTNSLGESKKASNWISRASDFALF